MKKLLFLAVIVFVSSMFLTSCQKEVISDLNTIPQESLVTTTASSRTGNFKITLNESDCSVTACLNNINECGQGLVRHFGVKYKGRVIGMYNTSNDIDPTDGPNCVTFAGLDTCVDGEYTFYAIYGNGRPGCEYKRWEKTFRFPASCCDRDDPNPNPVDCCILYRPTVTPTPSCTGVKVTHNPLDSNDVTCEDTTFEYILCDKNKNPIAPPIVTTDNTHQFLGLDLCKIYYVKGTILIPDCPPISYNVEIDLAPTCCRG